MKPLTLLAALLAATSLCAQDSTLRSIPDTIPTSNQEQYYPLQPRYYDFKGWLFVDKRRRIPFRSLQLLDNNRVEVTLGHGYSETILDTVHIFQIRRFRAIRKGAAKGAAAGLGGGGLVGYWVGKEMYESNEDGGSLGDWESLKRSFRVGGGITVSSTFIGTVIGGIFTPRNFRVDGDPDKFLFMINKLDDAMEDW